MSKPLTPLDQARNRTAVGRTFDSARQDDRMMEKAGAVLWIMLCGSLSVALSVAMLALTVALVLKLIGVI